MVPSKRPKNVTKSLGLQFPIEYVYRDMKLSAKRSRESNQKS